MSAFNNEQRFSKFQSLKLLKDLGFNPSFIIDIGFGIGTKGLFEHFTSPALIIEPVPLVEPIAQEFCRNRKKTFFLPACVSDDEGFVELYFNEGVTGSTIHAKKNEFNELVKVRSRTMESLAREFKFGKNCLVKIDIEGHELKALNGFGKNLLDVEVFIIECSLYNDYNEYGRSSFKEIYDFLHPNFFLWDILELGYRKLDGAMQQFDAVFVNRSSHLLKPKKMKTKKQGNESRANKKNKILIALDALKNKIR